VNYIETDARTALEKLKVNMKYFSLSVMFELGFLGIRVGEVRISGSQT